MWVCHPRHGYRPSPDVFSLKETTRSSFIRKGEAGTEKMFCYQIPYAERQSSVVQGHGELSANKLALEINATLNVC